MIRGKHMCIPYEYKPLQTAITLSELCNSSAFRVWILPTAQPQPTHAGTIQFREAESSWSCSQHARFSIAANP